MEQITLESLATVAGVVAAVAIVVQAIKVVYPGSLSAYALRTLSLVTGLVLWLVVTGFSEIPEDANVVLFWVLAALNGLVAGLAASGAVDTAKYGLDRITTR